MRKIIFGLSVFFLTTYFLLLTTPVVVSADWPMAGNNPERSGWSSEEVRAANLVTPIAQKTLNAYIPSKAQLIAANNLIYVTAADGVHALDYNTLNEVWHYATIMPAGNSPTIANGVLYVGAFDKKIHAVNATTGQPYWTFSGGVISDSFTGNQPRLLTGGRDGYFYALDASDPTNAGKSRLLWKYNAGSPISYSAAYKDGVIYFATFDNHAIALNVGSSSVLWNKNLQYGTGLMSFWPVIYKNIVIFAGSNHYGLGGSEGGRLSTLDNNLTLDPTKQNQMAWNYNFITSLASPNMAPLGPYIDVDSDGVNDWVDASWTNTYLTSNPHRDTIHMLNLQTGNTQSQAPIPWQGNSGSETRHPPIVLSTVDITRDSQPDTVVYFYAGFLWDPAIPWARTIGWDPDINPDYLFYPASNGGEAVDKPGAIAGSGKYIYLHTNRGSTIQAIDTSQVSHISARRIPAPTDTTRYAADQTLYTYERFRYNNINREAGVQDTHGIVNAPIPYQGTIYVHNNNTIYAYR